MVSRSDKNKKGSTRTSQVIVASAKSPSISANKSNVKEKTSSPAAAKVTTSQKRPAAAKVTTSQKPPAAAKVGTSQKAPAAAKVATSQKPPAAAKVGTSQKAPAAAKVTTSQKPPAAAKVTTSPKAPASARVESPRKTKGSQSEAAQRQKRGSIISASQRAQPLGKIKGVAHGLAFDNFKKVPREVAEQQMDLLCKRYPDADCELSFENTYQLITSVILSAQTTDSNVNRVTPKLFKRFPTARALAEADLAEVKQLIKSTGYYNAKAKNIQNCARAIVEKFAGEVPKTIEELTTLPGVGRKTANVVLGVAYHVPGWTVDTHVQRLSKRLGLTNNLDPEKIEYDLQKLFPGGDWTKLSITLIWHGRRLCYARNPDCAHCPINHLCPSAQI